VLRDVTLLGESIGAVLADVLADLPNAAAPSDFEAGRMATDKMNRCVEDGRSSKARETSGPGGLRQTVRANGVDGSRDPSG
jgi:hypothetical protein